MEILKREIVFESPYLTALKVTYRMRPDGSIKKWYGVARPSSVIVGVITKNEELILVRQPRVLVGANTVELPAGLRDIPGEPVLVTAERELLEETGYKAYGFEVLADSLLGSPGASADTVSLVVALDAEKVSEPEDNECTEPFLIPLSETTEWFRKNAKKENINFKDYCALSLIQEWYKQKRERV